MAIIGYIDGRDIAVIVAYFVLVFAVGIRSSKRNRGSVGGFQMIGGFDNMVVNYFNTIRNTTRTYRSTSFTHDGDLTTLSKDLYGTDTDRKTVWDAREPTDQSKGVYAAWNIPPSDAMDFKSISSTDLPWSGSIFGIVISSNTVACGDANMCYAVCGKRAGCTGITYPSMLSNLLPTAAHGLMLSAMMASLVSSLTSVFNSTSTIFTADRWKQIRPRCRDAELMTVGRIAVLVLVGVSLVWLPIVQSSEALMDYAQAIVAYLSPPIAAVYICGILASRQRSRCFLRLDHWPHFASLVTPPLPRSFTRRLIFQDLNAPFDPELDVLKMTIVSEEEKEEWIAEGEASFIRMEEGSQLDENEPVFIEEEAEEMNERRKREMSLTEDHTQKIIVNVGLACACLSTLFMWSFFA
ncbi:hypothetical protein Aperf_G00000061769 [Anoplocephala perfoliata]